MLQAGRATITTSPAAQNLDAFRQVHWHASLPKRGLVPRIRLLDGWSAQREGRVHKPTDLAKLEPIVRNCWLRRLLRPRRCGKLRPGPAGRSRCLSCADHIGE